MAPTRRPPLFITPNEIAYLFKHPASLNHALGYTVGMQDEHLPTAVAIVMAESNGNVFALNTIPPDESYGLAQINMRGRLGEERRARYKLASNEDLYLADVNIAIMNSISGSGIDFSAWSTYKTGAYRAFLSQAQEAAKYPADPGKKLKSPQDIQQQQSKNPIEEVIAWIQEQMLRVAGFIGGGVLIIVALALYARSQRK